MTSASSTWSFKSEIQKLSLNPPWIFLLPQALLIYPTHLQVQLLLKNVIYSLFCTFANTPSSKSSWSFCQNYCRISLLLLLCRSNPVSREQKQKLNQILCLKSFSGFSLFLNQYANPSLWPVIPCMMWHCHFVQPQFMPPLYWLAVLWPHWSASHP